MIAAVGAPFGPQKPGRFRYRHDQGKGSADRNRRWLDANLFRIKYVNCLQCAAGEFAPAAMPASTHVLPGKRETLRMTTLRHWGLGMAAVLLVAGCASSPGSIAPIAVNPERYAPLDCQALLTEQLRVSEALRAASDRQAEAARGDAIGVLLIGLPVSSMSGQDNAVAVAQLKGESDALRLAVTAKACGAAR